MDCSICLGDLAKGPLDVTPCGHPFHRHCLLQSLEFKKECPLCKATIREPHCRPLYLSFTRVSGTENLTQGVDVDVDELKETISRLEQERRELSDFKKKAKPKLAEHERMVAELKVLANTYKKQQEDCRAAEGMVLDLQKKVLEQRKELEQLQTLVRLHEIRNAGGELPAEVALSTPQQKDEYIRNQKQLLSWANSDIKELQQEKRELARQRNLLEAQVESLTQRIRAAARNDNHVPLQDRTNKKRKAMEPAAKPLQPVDTGVADDRPPSSEETSQPTTSLLAHHLPWPPFPTTTNGAGPTDHSIIEVADSSLEADDVDLLLGAAPALECPMPPSSQPVSYDSILLPRRSRSFLSSSPVADLRGALPFGPPMLATRVSPAFSAVHPVPTPPERTHQTTLRGLLRKA
eukprot:GGOE01047092.1.p1 GENE.GGOE01047092.1~~GGOE01047092.1.p1  ORF type:complete len:406 (+),score=113.43 GGOE01047092.1:44-1261(+)